MVPWRQDVFFLDLRTLKENQWSPSHNASLLAREPVTVLALVALLAVVTVVGVLAVVTVVGVAVVGGGTSGWGSGGGWVLGGSGLALGVGALTAMWVRGSMGRNRFPILP